MPRQIKFDLDWAKNAQEEIFMEFMEELSNNGEVGEADPRIVWEKHLTECEQQASSSGLDSEEKAYVPVTGILTEVDSHCIMFDDIFEAPTQTIEMLKYKRKM